MFNEDMKFAHLRFFVHCNESVYESFKSNSSESEYGDDILFESYDEAFHIRCFEKKSLKKSGNVLNLKTHFAYVCELV